MHGSKTHQRRGRAGTLVYPGRSWQSPGSWAGSDLDDQEASSPGTPSTGLIYPGLAALRTPLPSTSALLDAVRTRHTPELLPCRTLIPASQLPVHGTSESSDSDDQPPGLGDDTTDQEGAADDAPPGLDTDQGMLQWPHSSIISGNILPFLRDHDPNSSSPELQKVTRRRSAGSPGQRRATVAPSPSQQPMLDRKGTDQRAGPGPKGSPLRRSSLGSSSKLSARSPLAAAAVAEQRMADKLAMHMPLAAPGNAKQSTPDAALRQPPPPPPPRPAPQQPLQTAQMQQQPPPPPPPKPKPASAPALTSSLPLSEVAQRSPAPPPPARPSTAAAATPQLLTAYPAPPALPPSLSMQQQSVPQQQPAQDSLLVQQLLDLLTERAQLQATCAKAEAEAQQLRSQNELLQQLLEEEIAQREQLEAHFMEQHALLQQQQGQQDQYPLLQQQHGQQQEQHQQPGQQHEQQQEAGQQQQQQQQEQEGGGLDYMLPFHEQQQYDMVASLMSVESIDEPEPAAAHWMPLPQLQQYQSQQQQQLDAGLHGPVDHELVDTSSPEAAVSAHKAAAVVGSPPLPVLSGLWVRQEGSDKLQQVQRELPATPADTEQHSPAGTEQHQLVEASTADAVHALQQPQPQQQQQQQLRLQPGGQQLEVLVSSAALQDAASVIASALGSARLAVAASGRSQGVMELSSVGSFELVHGGSQQTSPMAQDQQQEGQLQQEQHQQEQLQQEQQQEEQLQQEQPQKGLQHGGEKQQQDEGTQRQHDESKQQQQEGELLGITERQPQQEQEQPQQPRVQEQDLDDQERATGQQQADTDEHNAPGAAHSDTQPVAEAVDAVSHADAVQPAAAS